MAEVETYTFSHLEILELLIKDAGIHEGEWMLQLNFGFSAGNIGPDDESVNPGAIIIVNHLGITKAKTDTPRGLKLDASEINPR